MEGRGVNKDPMQWPEAFAIVGGLLASAIVVWVLAKYKPWE